MAEPVCIATRTAGGGLILRWYRSPEHYGWRQEIATATAAGFKLHGWVNEIDEQVCDNAQTTHLLMRHGDPEAAALFATHRVQRFLIARRLVPVTPGSMHWVTTPVADHLSAKDWAQINRDGGRP